MSSVPSLLQRRIAALDAQDATQAAPALPADAAPAPAPTPMPVTAAPPTNVVSLINPSAVTGADDSTLLAMFSDPTPVAPPLAATAPTPQATAPAVPQYAAPVAAPTSSDPELLIRLGRLEAENERYRVATAPAEAKDQGPALIALAIDAAPLTDEERHQYAPSLPIMRKVFDQQLGRAMAPALEHIANLERRLAAQHETTAKQISTTANRAFQAAVAAKIPDIRTHFDDPRFRQFQAQSAPFTGSTYGDVLRAAWDGQDLGRVDEVVSAYLRTSAPRATPDPTAFSQPAASPAPVAATQANVLLASKRSAAVQAYARGRITGQDMARIDALYNKAELEGRVDHTR